MPPQLRRLGGGLFGGGGPPAVGSLKEVKTTAAVGAPSTRSVPATSMKLFCSLTTTGAAGLASGLGPVRSRTLARKMSVSLAATVMLPSIAPVTFRQT